MCAWAEPSEDSRALDVHVYSGGLGKVESLNPSGIGGLARPALATRVIR